MNKPNCDIIGDLIPSYLDNICSEATKQCVEEHLGSCDKCRQLVKFCRENTLSGEKLDQQGVDGLKKARKLLRFRNLSYYLMLAAILCLALWMPVFKIVNPLTDSILFAAFLFCILAVLWSAFRSRKNRPLQITEYLLGGGSLLLSVYFAAVFYYVIERLRAGAESVFGLPLHSLGPFLENQILAAFVLQGILIVHNLSCFVNQEKDGSWLLCLNISGVFLLLRYDLLLYHMDTWDTLLKALNSISLDTAAVCLLSMAVCLVIKHCRARKAV